MADFATLVPDALGFFEDLAQNNDRDWFAAEKLRYEAVVKRPAEVLLDTLGAWLTAETGRAQTPKLYRINRDLRFSRDKTPYNTHLHLQWSDAGGLAHLFGVSPDYVCAGVGAMGFDNTALERWRAGVAGPAGDDLAAQLDAAKGRLDQPALKRVPAPYDQDHPRADLLKRKGIVLWHDLDGAEQARPLEAMKAAFTRFAAFRDSLAAILATRD